MIQTNPFYILNIPMNASKGVIAAAAEALALGDSSFDGEAIMSMLVNPDGRLAAELGWFPDAGREREEGLMRAIRASEPADTRGLAGLSLLNASMYNFGIAIVADESPDLARTFAEQIWRISEYYNRIDPKALTDSINSLRAEAGVTPAGIFSVAEALSERRYDISDEIDKLLTSSVSPDMYRRIVYELAKGMLSRSDMKIRMVINDIIDKYEIRNNAELSELADKVTEISGKIVASKGNTSAAMSLSKEQLKTALEKWVEVARPMLARADVLDVDYPEGTELRNAAFTAMASIGNDKRFEGHYAMAVNLSRDLKWIFVDNRRLAEPFSEITEEAKERTRQSREFFRRSGLYRGAIAFFGFSSLVWCFMMIALMTSPNVPPSKEYPVMFVLSLAFTVYTVYLIIKSMKARQKYDEEQRQKNNK